MSVGQSTLHVHVQNEPFGILAPGAFEEIVSGLDAAKLSAVNGGTWEEKVKDSGQSALALFVKLEFGDFHALYTTSTRVGDVLVAQWSGAANRPERTIWLWDEPQTTMVLLEVSSSLIEPSRFVAYCEDLVVWDKSPLHLKKVQLHYGSSAQNAGQIVAGRGVHEESPTGALQWWLVAGIHAERAYVLIGATMPFFETKYPADAYFIRERFPPLLARLHALPRDLLFRELAKGSLSQ